MGVGRLGRLYPVGLVDGATMIFFSLLLVMLLFLLSDNPWVLGIGVIALWLGLLLAGV